VERARDGARDDWETPPEFFAAAAAAVGGLDLDVCAAVETAKCARYYSVDDDGLSASWAGARVWCNPPYAELRRWAARAAEAAESGEALLVAVLAPLRLETRWADRLLGSPAFRGLVVPPRRLAFFRGGVEAGSPPMATGLYVLGQLGDLRALGRLGRVLVRA